MAEKFSTGLVNYLLNEGCLKQGMQDFILKFFSGTAPASADDAEGGATVLCKLTKNSQPVDLTELSIAKQAMIEITVATTGNTVIVAINGVDYTYTVLAEDDDLRKVARKVALMLSGIPEVIAVALAANGADGKIAVQSRIAGLSFTIAKGGGGGGGTATWTVTDNTIANSRSDALQWGSVAAGKISKEAGNPWSGVNLANGVASWFRVVLPDDDGLASTTRLRIQGAVATSGAEINMNSTTFTQNATTTQDSLDITIPMA
jgi:hypothetical protein